MSEDVLGGGVDPDLEARLVALILGEASEFEVEALERVMESRPEVREIKLQLEVMHGLVYGAVSAESLDDDGWKLSPVRRSHVMKTLGIGSGGNGHTEEPNGNGERKDARIQRAGRKVIWAAAACLMINVVIFGWLISKTLVQRAAGEAKSESAIVSYDRTESMKSQLESHAEGFEGIADASSAQPATKELDEAILSSGRRIAVRERMFSGGELDERRARRALANMREQLRDGGEDSERGSGAAKKRPASPARVTASVTPSPTAVPVPTAEPDLVIKEELALEGVEFIELMNSSGGRLKLDSLAELSNAPGEKAAPGRPPIPLLPPSGPNQVASGGQIGGGVLPDLSADKSAAGSSDNPVTLNAVNLNGPERNSSNGVESRGPPVRGEAEVKLLLADEKEGGGILQRETARRAEGSRDSDELLNEGRRAYAKGDYEEAMNKYRESLDSLPEGASTAGRRRQVEMHLADGTVAYSQSLRRRGQYDEAKKNLEGALSVDPSNQRAKQELEYLADPIRTSPALTFEHTRNVDKVRRHLYTAEGFKNLALYDDAIQEYQKTLRVDPYNSAARRGMESIHKLKSDHYRAAYDESRARMLAQVDESWERTVPPPAKDGGGEDSAFGPILPAFGGLGRSSASVDDKLKNIVIPEIDFENTTVDEAIDFLRHRARELDSTELDPSRKGLNFVVRKPRILGGIVDEELDAESDFNAVDPGSVRIKSLKLKNVPLDVALQKIAEQAGMRYRTDEYAVTLLPVGSGEGDDLVTRKWKVSPTFLSDLQDSGEAGEPDPFGGDETGLSGSLKPRRPLIDMLKEAGISFPPGSSAQFVPSTGTLIVNSSPSNLDLVDQLTAHALESAPPPASIDRGRFNDLYKKRSGFRADGSDLSAKSELIAYKLKNIIVPVVDFDDATVQEAMDFIRSRAREMDTFELDPTKKGINFHLGTARVEPALGLDPEFGLGAADPGLPQIKELKLRNVPMATVLQYICDQARLRYRIDDHGVTLLPIGAGESDDIQTRTWEIHPDLIEELQATGLHDAGEPDSVAEPMTERERAAWRQRQLDRPLMEVFRDVGVDFPSGASVHYIAATNVLIVSNTPSNHDLVDHLLEFTATEMSQKETAEEALETNARDEAFSTFSLHVSDVSFKLAKATLAKGEWPAAGQLRVEEFVNAFDYDDPSPRMREKVACRLEQAAHPFMQQRNLLRISMRTAAVGRSGGTPLRLTVLLDKSGSMERLDRAESVQRALGLLTGQLNGADLISVISFSRTPRLLVDRVPGNKAGMVPKLVANTPSQGGTNLEEALRAGLEKAREQKIEGGQNRIILLTDGAANLGNAKPEDLAKLVESMRQEGISFDACGVGAAGLNDEILESLTRKGDGRYYFLDRPEDADEGFARQIAGALRPAARNVKVQVHFNPRRVGYYKLYGFEKHRLETQDFRNDSVDAAEMAAAEAGNAVYQMEVRPDGEGEIGTVSVRFQDMATGEMVERKWTIPYEGDAPRLSEAPPSMRLAASAALLGEKLNGSPMGDRVQLQELVKITNSLRTDYPRSARVGELIEMTAKARELE